MRCNRCGNENSETHRFCGMCGAGLLAAPAPAPTAAPPAKVTPVPVVREIPVREVPKPAPASEVRVEPPRRDPVPSISGPSFLGLNQPGPARGSNSEAGNLDYLLQDEEEEPQGGSGKIILIVVALVLVVGLGYLRWRHGGLPWISSAGQKPAASQPADPSQPPAGEAGTRPPAPAANAATPAPTAAQPAADPNPPAAAPDAAASHDSQASMPASSQPATEKPESSTSPDAAEPAKSSAEEDGDAGDAEPAKPAPKLIAKPAPAKPAPAKPAPADRVAEAERYIYGKGVQQNCDRGLSILRPAAEQSNAKAMISLGALYSAGLCTPRDLPTAYRWFALALRKQPENDAVQTDLKKLWSEMTQPERNLAIKLSQ